MYERAIPGSRAIDMRSDTVTRPSPGMREAMMSAPLGDDVFRDDPTVLELETTVAEYLGKEAGLFMPSGTMANQIAIRIHTRHGDEVIAHEGAHLYNYESGAQAALAGIAVRPIASVDGSLPFDDVRSSLHLSDDPHYAPTGLVAFENTHNQCGGRIIPQDNIEVVAALAKSHGIPVHLDGARLGNAIVATGADPVEMAAPFDTISICFSKGLGAPIGSVLVGTQAHIAQGIRYRKMYGGGMRQGGVIASAALYALTHQLEDLALDHVRAKHIAMALDALPGVRVDVAGVHTNLVYFSLDNSHPMVEGGDGSLVLKRLAEEGVLVTGGGTRFRSALHRDLSESDVEKALAVMARVLGR